MVVVENEPLTSADWIVFGVSMGVITIQLAAELIPGIYMMVGNVETIKSLLTLLEFLFALSIIFDLCLVLCATYFVMSPLKDIFEEFVKSIVTLFLGVVGVNFVAITMAFMSMLHQVVEFKPLEYIPIMTNPPKEIEMTPQFVSMGQGY